MMWNVLLNLNYKIVVKNNYKRTDLSIFPYELWVLFRDEQTAVSFYSSNYTFSVVSSLINIKRIEQRVRQMYSLLNL